MIHRSQFEIEGRSHTLLRKGEGEVVVLLHGFPDSCESFVPLMTEIAEAGFKV